MKETIPRGCLAIKVGREGEEQEKFVVPVVHLNHPLFFQLLKEAEEEYGFDQKGTITLPCRVDEFVNIQKLIDRDHHHCSSSRIAAGSHAHNNNNNNGHHTHLHLVGCFKASSLESYVN